MTQNDVYTTSKHEIFPRKVFLAIRIKLLRGGFHYSRIMFACVFVNRKMLFLANSTAVEGVVAAAQAAFAWFVFVSAKLQEAVCAVFVGVWSMGYNGEWFF